MVGNPTQIGEVLEIVHNHSVGSKTIEEGLAFWSSSDYHETNVYSCRIFVVDSVLGLFFSSQIPSFAFAFVYLFWISHATSHNL